MRLDLLLIEMQKKGVSKDDLAKGIGVDRATIYRKFAKNGDPFTIKEARSIADILVLDSKTAAKIFFSR